MRGRLEPSVIETNATIFVVDDDVSVRKALNRLMKSVGFTVETFASAQEFLNYAPCEDPGLLVLDVRMPGMSGLELQKQLIASGSEIPIIFITAHEDPEAHTLAMEGGAIAFFQKPFDDQKLFDAIHLALDQNTRGLPD